MKLKEKVTEVQSLATTEVMTGSGEISASTYARAESIFGQLGILGELSKSLAVDCAGFFADAAVALGMLSGLHRRLQSRMHREEGEALGQPAAFFLVDLHGRILGIEAMVLEVASMLESATTQRLAEGTVRARMGTAFLMTEQVVAEACAELVRRGGFADVAQAVEKVTQRIRTRRKQQYQGPLSAHLGELPA